MKKTVRVELGPRSYDIHIDSGLMATLGDLVTQILPSRRKAVVIADSTVANLYADPCLRALAAAGLNPSLLTFPAGERHKTLATYSQLMDQLLGLTPAIDRRCVVVALGGGVTGDIAGFVAATALRGLDWLQCPTTLLADVDASVGGKTAVDHAAGKNLIGAFHQPRGVLIDVDTLASLPAEQLSNGLAECVKHAVIRDAKLLDFLENNAPAIFACQRPILAELVAANVAIKAAVVSADERETGQRAHLNFGHTIGHAIETLVGYDRIGHGAAVSLGMVAACRLAADRRLIDRPLCQRIEALLKQLRLPVRYADLAGAEIPAPQQILQVMQHDKKTLDGKLRMVLPLGLGQAAIFDDITAPEIQTALTALS